MNNNIMNLDKLRMIVFNETQTNIWKALSGQFNFIQIEKLIENILYLYKKHSMKFSEMIELIAHVKNMLNSEVEKEKKNFHRLNDLKIVSNNLDELERIYKEGISFGDEGVMGKMMRLGIDLFNCQFTEDKNFVRIMYKYFDIETDETNVYIKIR